jgi:hypothetical protein
LRPPQIEDRHVGGEVAPALLVHALKVSVPKQASTARKPGPFARARQIGTPIWSAGGHSSQPRLRVRTSAIPEKETIHGTQASPRPACGLWRAGAKPRPGRSWSSYEYEIRASSSDDAG